MVGNRLHLAFKRQVPTEQAQAYAERLGVTFFEVSPLCNFNITESFTELARIVLLRHGMDRLWRPSKGMLGGQSKSPLAHQMGGGSIAPCMTVCLLGLLSRLLYPFSKIQSFSGSEMAEWGKVPAAKLPT